MSLIFRALCDHQPDDSSLLAFRQGDVIQVVAKLETGWWDGSCRGNRGWFPSQFVTEMETEKEGSTNKVIYYIYCFPLLLAVLTFYF
jgi:son of sevenless-like protein